MRDFQVTIFPNLLKTLIWEYLSSKIIFWILIITWVNNELITY